jgi:hypothetical protein
MISWWQNSKWQNVTWHNVECQMTFDQNVQKKWKELVSMMTCDKLTNFKMTYNKMSNDEKANANSLRP